MAVTQAKHDFIRVAGRCDVYTPSCDGVHSAALAVSSQLPSFLGPSPSSTEQPC